MSSSNTFIYTPPLQPLRTLYQDDDVIVIDKPAGLLSVMGRLPEHQDSAYLRILAQYPEAKVIHRLDMATSGLLMFAKHQLAAAAFSRLFQKRGIEKRYTAWVEGEIVASGHIDLPLITDWEQRPKQKVDLEQGKASLTYFERISFDPERQISRVLLRPITGRSHQLRVHLQQIGHPIMGDRYYHPQPSRIGLGRMALHAHHLSFEHPLTQQRLSIESCVPF